MEVREKLVELLMQVEDNMCDDCGREPVGCAVVAIADHLIANDVAVQGAADTNVGSKWISVKDRLPKDGNKVIVYSYENGDFHTAELDGKLWHLDCGWLLDVDDFTHWMPLPKPPKGE